MARNNLENEVKAVHDKLLSASSDNKHKWHMAVELARTEYGADILSRRVPLNQFRGFVELFDRLAFEYSLSEFRSEQRKQDALLLARYLCGAADLSMLKAHATEHDWFWGKVLYCVQETLDAQVGYIDKNPESVRDLLKNPFPDFDAFIKSCNEKKHLDFVKCLFPFSRKYAQLELVQENLIAGLAKRHVAPDPAYLAVCSDVSRLVNVCGGGEIVGGEAGYRDTEIITYKERKL